MKRIIYLAIALGMTSPLVNSCRESALEPALSQDKPLEGNVNNAEALKSLLSGIYSRMSDGSYYGRDVILYGEVRSDNAFSSGATHRFVELGQMKLIDNSIEPNSVWPQLNSIIVSTNIIINANNVSGNKDEVAHYKGESYALRALAHFDLLKIFGQQDVAGEGGMSALGIPYVKEFGEVITPKRNTVQEVYDNIMADLDRAISLMPASKDSPTRHTITTNAVKALKARVALYFKQYDIAAKYAKEVIDSGEYNIASPEEFATTFNTDSTSNQIFSIDNNDTDNTGINSLARIYTSRKKHGFGDIEFLKDLYSIYEDSDVRKEFFTISEKATEEENRYRCKKMVDPSLVGSYDIPIIRYEEVILIYAEALLKQGNASTALTYLNQIAENRGETPYQVATMDNILLERRKEFAGEGFRFYDLVRTGRDIPVVDKTLQTYGGGPNRDQAVPYGSYKLAFPFQLRELRANKFIKQNKGY